jgi:hypothetical protein
MCESVTGYLSLTATDTKKCKVLKDFSYRGQQLLAYDQYKCISGDVIELEPSEAKELQSKGLVSAYPAADRFKCGPEGITGWRPWNNNYGAATCDWNGRAGLDLFDDCLIRIAYLGSIGGVQLCPGLDLSAADGSIYFPFGAIRALGGYHCEDDREPVAGFRIYLDELAPQTRGDSNPINGANVKVWLESNWFSLGSPSATQPWLYLPVQGSGFEIYSLDRR